MNLYEKIHAIMSEVESLQKDGRVTYGQNYNYLSEAKTTTVFKEQFAKHKLVLIPIKAEETIHPPFGVSREDKGKGFVTHGIYTYKLINAENPDEFELLQAGGQGYDSTDKGSGKASSYAFKYLLWRTFTVPSNDDPDQFSSAELLAQGQAVDYRTELLDLIKEKGLDFNDIALEHGLTKASTGVAFKKVYEALK